MSRERAGDAGWLDYFERLLDEAAECFLSLMGGVGVTSSSGALWGFAGGVPKRAAKDRGSVPSSPRRTGAAGLCAIPAAMYNVSDTGIDLESRRPNKRKNNKPKEGQGRMEDKDKEKDAAFKEIVEFLKRGRAQRMAKGLAYVQRYGMPRLPGDAMVRLRGGSQLWPFAEAGAVLGVLRFMPKTRPDEFAALMVLVRPSRATMMLPKTPPAEGLAKLKEAELVREDGSVEPLYAAMLEAAYEEVGGKIVLNDPIVYPPPEPGAPGSGRSRDGSGGRSA